MVFNYKVFTFATLLFLFVGCGEESNYTSQSQAPTGAEPFLVGKLSGSVVDGYIEDAQVCYDANMNGICDVDEPSTFTDADGSYSLELGEQNSSLVQIVALGGVDSSTGRAFSDTFRSVVDTTEIDTNATTILSPITDLVAHAFENAQNKEVADLEDAQQSISELLSLTIEQLSQDPMLDINIFTHSQILQHTKLLLEEVSKKHLQDFSLQKIQDEIKREIIEMRFDVEKILIALEIRLDFTIPNNEKEFVTLQAQELKNTLNSLSRDTSLSLENLNALQKALDIKQQDAYILIQNAEANSTLEVIELNITTQSLTQTIFDTTNAVYDENACIDEDMLALSNNAFFPDKTTDITNGISIKSNYPLTTSTEDSQVTIYYPTLTEEKTNDLVVIFDDENNFYFTYDSGWVENEKKTLYLKTPKNTQGLYSCYRYELTSDFANEIKSTKVFSYTPLYTKDENETY